MQKNKRFFDAIYILIMLLVPGLLSSQVVVGSGTADGSSLLEVKSNTGGVLLPRMTSAERDAIASPATGLLVFNLTTICLESNMGTPSSPDWTPVTCRTGAITGINCAGATVIGTLAIGQAATNVIATVPYTGGNSGVYSGQAVTSTGVTGLTATLPAGHFADGSGSLSFIITGTPSAVGTANFALNIGGQSCTLSASVSYSCKAKTDATTFSNFLCYNLGAANTNADPFTPSWEINGGYWQWGRLAQAVSGPTGPNAGDANDGVISGWNTTYAPAGSWSDASKTSNDPCPAGYRVPTMTQWEGVILNNTLTNVGSWTSNSTNYSSGKNFGTELFLPAVGDRKFDNGTLRTRGQWGNYWSSTENDATTAWFTLFFSSGVFTSNGYSTHGFAVRCIEYPAAIGSLDCGGRTVTGTLTPGQAASGVSVSIPYTGGNGSAHSGQTVTSTGVTGLTATLPAGNFALGSGSLLYEITGTPSGVGTASFIFDIGGHSCTASLNVAYVCRAKIDATTYKNFMCHNLGAANMSADPFTPSWEINGGYWQWGRLAQAAAGPTGPNAGDANGGAISGWSTTVAPNGSWADGSKTSNDPCPAGYRVPTRAQWEGVIANNIATNVGTSWTVSPANYSTGKKFGNELMLPAAGYRNASDGKLSDRGAYVSYWSSTESYNQSWNMWFQNNYVDMDTDLRSYGMVVRCIEE